MSIFRSLHWFITVFLLGLALSIAGVSAHEMRPAIVDVILDEKGAVQVEAILNAEALVAGIGAEHDDTDDAPEAARYNALRALSPGDMAARLRAFASRLTEGVTLTVDGVTVPLALGDIAVEPQADDTRARQSRVTLTGAVPPDAEALTWSYAPEFGDSVVRLKRADNLDVLFSAYAAAGNTLEVPVSEAAPPQTAGSVFVNYIPVGFAHIIPKGLDHILFVIGLFLLSPRAKPLLWQVTTFTLAHSVTLALAALGVVMVSPAIVEPLIAASIAFIALENIFASGLGRWRLVTVFVFGLLHGLGFASVLAEFGLPPGQFVAGLIGFNIGVEVGQLAVIAACFLAVGWFVNRDWYRSVITIPASLIIAAIALYWVTERVGMFG